MANLRTSALVGCVLAATALGCGAPSDFKRAIVTGKITYQGTPVSHGEVLLLPEPGATGPISGGRFADGVYRIDAHGGVPVGTYRVEIKGYRELPGQKLGPGDPDYGDREEQILPSKYNSESELKLTVESSSGALTKDFLLE